MAIILRQNENLIKTVRKHSMFLMPVFFSWPFIVVGLLVARYGLHFGFFGYWKFILVVAILIVALIVLYRYYIWKMDALIITDQRVIENEQHGFFSKTVTELLYQDILEISYSKSGLNSSIYNFGDIKIRTAAQNEIVFDKVANPSEVVEIINSVRQTSRQSNG